MSSRGSWWGSEGFDGTRLSWHGTELEIGFQKGTLFLERGHGHLETRIRLQNLVDYGNSIKEDVITRKLI